MFMCFFALDLKEPLRVLAGLHVPRLEAEKSPGFECFLRFEGLGLSSGFPFKGICNEIYKGSVKFL